MKKITYATILLVLLFIAAAFLRLYRLEAFTTFLADQGRDAIIMKRLITFEHLPAIGPPSSIGQIMLGPFFYYLIAPFLLLFKFNPIGMAYGVAGFTIAGLAICFSVVKKEFGGFVAVMFALLITFSFVNIEFARFSWNPNLLPIFSFLTLYSFYQFLTHKKQLLFAFLTGFLFALSIQLHHLAFFMGPAMLIYLFIHKTGKKVFPERKSWMALIGAFVLGYSPLILFDLKHQFLNTKNLFKLFSGGELVAKSSLINRVEDSIHSFVNHVFIADFTPAAAGIVFILLIAAYIAVKKHGKVHPFLELNFIMVISYLIFFSFLSSNRYPHYYAAIYYSFYLVLAYLLSALPRKQIAVWFVLAAFAVLYIVNQVPKYYFLYEKGSYQIPKAQRVAQSILDRHPQTPYQVAGLPSTEPEDHIRYFLELNGPRPLAADSNDETKELYVICHQECQPLADPQYQIAAFRHGKISESWHVDDLVIYKAIHEK